MHVCKLTSFMWTFVHTPHSISHICMHYDRGAHYAHARSALYCTQGAFIDPCLHAVLFISCLPFLRFDDSDQLFDRLPHTSFRPFTALHGHNRKILHRDLKTVNVCFIQDNKVKLCEFGIAKVLHSTSQLTALRFGVLSLTLPCRYCLRADLFVSTRILFSCWYSCY